MDARTREPRTVEANVEPLFGVANLGNHTPDDVRELIEDLNERMLRGEISAIAVTTINPARHVATDWASGASPHNLLIAGTATLGHRVIAAMAIDT